MVRGTDWEGLLEGKRTLTADLQMVAPLQQSSSGGSGAFQVRGSDNNRYWVKVLNNPQGQRVPITEQIVGRVGSLIGAPCCQVLTLGIPSEFAGWEFRPGIQLQPGIGSASRSIENVVEKRILENRHEDSNTTRHAYIHALYDWCWGSDAQWLVEIGDENKYHSHDHGWYLPPSGPEWTEADLLACLNTPNQFNGDWVGIPREEALQVASRLESITREQLATALSGIPKSWPVADIELEAVGHFLENRAPQVAERIRRTIGGTP